jgi:hypothetical protein
MQYLQMQYLMTLIWLASFLENDNVSGARREMRYLRVLLKHSMLLIFRVFFVMALCRAG